jgi:hypothetical protein
VDGLLRVVSILSIPMFFLLLANGWSGFKAVLNYAGLSKRRGEDISHKGISPSSTLEPVVDSLISLGFTRLGETLTYLPLVSLGGITWLFLDESGTTCADVIEVTGVDAKPMLAFWTTFDDAATIETGYPTGERIDISDLRSHTVPSSVKDAYQHHLQQVADFGTHHGAPIRFRNMDDYLRQEAIYREHHARRKFRRLFLDNLVNVTSCIYALCASIAVVVSMRHSKAFTIQLLWDKLLRLTVLLTPAVVITFVVSQVSIWMGRKSLKE